jgi:hypothetical protein
MNRGRIARIALLGAALAACTPFGLARGDYWAGISTGDLGPCPAFDFDINVDEDNIGGVATSEYPFGTVLWDVRGVKSGGGQVQVETRTGDPRVAPQRLVWTGTYNAVLWDLTQPGGSGCPKPRTARLQRK